MYRHHPDSIGWSFKGFLMKHLPGFPEDIREWFFFRAVQVNMKGETVYCVFSHKPSL